PAASISFCRSSRDVPRMGSTLLIRNGSMMVRIAMTGMGSSSRHYHRIFKRFREGGFSACAFAVLPRLAGGGHRLDSGAGTACQVCLYLHLLSTQVL